MSLEIIYLTLKWKMKFGWRLEMAKQNRTTMKNLDWLIYYDKMHNSFPIGLVHSKEFEQIDWFIAEN